MKRYFIVCLIAFVLFTGTCIADGYDLEDMTTQQLNQLKSDINKQIEANHEATSSERSRIESVVKTCVDDYYGSDNVSWAWFDYTYTKEWDYFTMSTHADIKKGNEKIRCDIFADVFRSNDQYQIAYLMVGNDELVNKRNETITDPRVRTLLGLSSTPNAESALDAGTETSSTPEENEDYETESSTDSDDDIIVEEPEPTEAPVIAKVGDRNDTVKQIQSMLIRLGYLGGKAEGDFGKKTEAAVVAFQRDNGMEQTGVVTQEVYNAIKNASESIPEPVTYANYTAKEVYSSYESNEIAADSEFKGKTIEVTGKIYEIGKSLFGTPYVYLKADSYGFKLLHFKFSRNDLDQLATYKENQTITIRAKCSGKAVVVVYFDDSEVIK